MNHKLTLIIFAILNFILALSSGFFLAIVLMIFFNGSDWDTYPDPGFVIQTVFFWTLALVVLSLQAVYLRFRIRNNAWQGKAWFQITLLLANLALALLICNYGLKETLLEVSFTHTFWHLKVLKAAAIPTISFLFILANIGLLFRKEQVKKWQLLRK